jgi:hypothetical protein
MSKEQKFNPESIEDRKRSSFRVHVTPFDEKDVDDEERSSLRFIAFFDAKKAFMGWGFFAGVNSVDFGKPLSEDEKAYYTQALVKEGKRKWGSSYDGKDINL